MKNAFLKLVFGCCVTISACGGSETPGKVVPISDDGERRVGGPAQSMLPDAGEGAASVALPDAGSVAAKPQDMGPSPVKPLDMGPVPSDAGVPGVAVDTMPVSVVPGVLLSQGTMCKADSDCKSGFCTDGVCCNEECRGTCRSCKGGGGQPGVCLAAVGADPDNECGNSTCTVSSAGAAMCLAMCKMDSECKTGFTCEAGVCQAVRKAGEACSRVEQCEGNCVNKECSQAPGGHRYLSINNIDASWESKRTACQKRGWDLVVVNTAGEDAWLNTALNSWGGSAVDIGLKRTDKGWTWIDGSVFKGAEIPFVDGYIYGLAQSTRGTSLIFSASTGGRFFALCETK